MEQIIESWHKRNAERLKKYRAEYYKKNKESISRKCSEYYANNSSRIKNASLLYYKNNKELVIKRSNRYSQKRAAEDGSYRMRIRLRTSVWRSVKRNFKAKKSTESIIGCTMSDFKAHLEKLFTAGMTWDNYGKWHIDHIIPCASFNLLDEDEVKKCFHFTNMQPMWAVLNRIKSDRLPCGTTNRKKKKASL